MQYNTRTNFILLVHRRTQNARNTLFIAFGKHRAELLDALVDVHAPPPLDCTQEQRNRSSTSTRFDTSALCSYCTLPHTCTLGTQYCTAKWLQLKRIHVSCCAVPAPEKPVGCTALNRADVRFTLDLTLLLAASQRRLITPIRRNYSD